MISQRQGGMIFGAVGGLLLVMSLHAHIVAPDAPVMDKLSIAASGFLIIVAGFLLVWDPVALQAPDDSQNAP